MTNTGDNIQGRRVAYSRPFANNTSLEDISDWLTKIIIGISLVQFQAIWQELYRAAYYAAAFLSGSGMEQSSKFVADVLPANMAAPYFFALIMVGLGAGCAFAYLETRTRLSLLFLGAQDALDWREIGALESSADRKVAEGRLGETPRASPATSEDERIAQLPRGALKGAKEIVGWASAQARLGNFQLAEAALGDELRREPKDTDLNIRLAEVLYLQGKHADAFKIISDLASRTKDQTDRRKLLHEALGLALYLPPPSSFDHAITLSDQLIKEGGMGATAWLWRAAAFGQKYLWLEQHPGTPDDPKSSRDKALEAVRRTVELAPDEKSDERTLLREIYDPLKEHSDRNENDLEVFRLEKDHKDFDDLIYGAHGTPPA